MPRQMATLLIFQLLEKKPLITDQLWSEQQWAFDRK
jgi:hypothetical protein